MSLQPLLSVADVAAIVGLSEYTIRQAVREGDLPASKLRGRIRIRETDVHTWIATSPAAEPRVARARLDRAPAPGRSGVEVTPDNVQAMIAAARRSVA